MQDTQKQNANYDENMDRFDHDSYSLYYSGWTYYFYKPYGSKNWLNIGQKLCTTVTMN